MIDFYTIISKAILSLTSELFIVVLVTICYLNYSKPIFTRALFLLLFTMVFNSLLKYMWHIPLPPEVSSDGYAFPSGHMQSSAAFWGWLAYELRKKWLNYFVITLLFAIGCSLIYMGYHNYNDVIFANIFALVEILFYRLILTKVEKEEEPYLGLAFAVLAILVIFIIPKSMPNLWLALGAMLGFSIGSKANNKLIKIKESDFRIPKNCLALLLITVTYAAIFLLKGKISFELTFFISFFALSFIISYLSEAIVQKIWLKKEA